MDCDSSESNTIARDMPTVIVSADVAVAHNDLQEFPNTIGISANAWHEMPRLLGATMIATAIG